MSKSDELDCKNAMKLVSSYLDKDLDPNICNLIETHTSGCKPCDSMLVSLKKTVELCLEYEPNGLPEIQKVKIRKELEEELAAFKKLVQDNSS